MAQKLDDLFNMFDTFQEVLYSNDVQNSVEQEKAVYEESILTTILGNDYQQHIDYNTGEWKNQQKVLENFYIQFEERIKALFGVGLDLELQ